MAKLNYLNSEIRISVNSDPAKNAFQSLLTAAEGLRKQLEQMKAAGLKDGDIEVYNKLASDLNLLEGTVKKSVRSLKDIDSVLNDLSGASMKKLQEASKKLRKDIAGLSEGDSDKLKTKLMQLAAVENQIKKINDGITAQKSALNLTGEAFDDLGTKVKPLTAAEKEIQKIKESLNEVRVNLTRGNLGASSLTKLQEAAKGLRAELSEKSSGSIVDGEKTLEELKAVEGEIKRVTDTLKGVPKPLSDAEKEAEELRKEQEKVRNETQQLNRTLQDLDNASLDDLRKSADILHRRLNAMSQDERKNNRQMEQDLQRVEGRVESLTNSYRRQSSTIGNTIRRLVSYVSVYASFNMLKNSLTSVVNKNLEFSDSLADIKKTTGLSTEGVKELSDAIMKIDTRTSVQELHNLAYEAGRLGIGGGGAEAVLGFTRAANQLKVALGEDLGEDAIVQLAKMADVMGTSKKMGVEKALLATGSAINELSQSSTASGQFISDYAQRLSGIATQAHLTTAELLGFAAASDATGQEVEVSATAMNKFVVQLQTHYKTVAQAAGVSEEALHRMLTMGQTADAVVMVLEALSQKGGLSMLAPLMKDLGSDGARLTASLSTMASNIGLVKQQLEISRSAFEDAISVTNEYNVKNENAAAIMERMRNSWSKLFTNADNTEVVNKLAKDLYDLSNSLQQSTTFITSLTFALNTLAFTVKSLLAMTPFLLTFFSLKGIVIGLSHIPKLLVGLKAIGNAFIVVETSAEGATKKVVTFGSALRGAMSLFKSNVIWIAISAIAALVVKLRESTQELSDMEQSLKSFDSGVKRFEKDTHAAGIEVNTLFARLKNANKGTKEHKDLILQINKQYGQYLPFLIDEKTSLEKIAAAQDEVNKKLRQSLALKAKNAAMDEAGQMYTPKMAETLQRMQELYDKRGVEKVGQADVRYLVEKTQFYYGKGFKFDNIVELLQHELYNYKMGSRAGRSGHLVEPGGEMAVYRDELYRLVQNYIAYFWNQNLAIKRASEKYDPLIGDYTESSSDNAPYTIVEAEGKGVEDERLREAKKEHKAIMAALEAYYKQQEQAVNESYLRRELTITEREQRLEEIEKRHLRSRIAARAAILDRPGAQDDWQDELIRMQGENKSGTSETNAAFALLRNKNPQKVGENLRKYGEGEIDGVWKNYETDKNLLLDNDVKLRLEIESILRENDFTAIVTDEYMAAMQRLGLLFPKQMEDMETSARAAMKGLEEMYSDIKGLDINTNEGLNAYRQMLAERKDLDLAYLNDKTEKSKEQTDKEIELMKLLYYKTIDYGDAMVAAREKAMKKNQKVADAIWRQSGGVAKVNDLDNKEMYLNDTVGALSEIGLSSEEVANDFEIEIYTQKMNAALAYRDTVVECGGDIIAANAKVEESINELSEKLLKKTIDNLKEYKKIFEPLQGFGESLGEAFAMDDSIKKQEKFRESLVNLAEEVGDVTKEMITNWIKQKIQHFVTRKAMEKQEQIHQATNKAITTTGMATEQTIVEAGEQAKAMAVQQSEIQISTIKATKSAENITTEVSETVASSSLNIAQGSAKTIGKLGWWGIPLVAVISALIGGLMSWAMSKVKGSGITSSVDNSSASAPTKLVTGMLTYDKGNVQTMLGDDGRLYQTRIGGVDGTGLVTVPTLTNVAGQPAIIGEQGPELVIGRATTKALMQDNSGLLQGLIAFDKMYSGRGFKTYDRGNVQTLGTINSNPTSNDFEKVMNLMMARIDESLAPSLERVSKALDDSVLSNTALINRLSKPITANINKYGRGGLVEEVADGMLKERKIGRNETLKKLFKD